MTEVAPNAAHASSNGSDYTQLPQDQSILARSSAEEIRGLQHQDAGLQFEIGARLLRVKTSLGHGHFGFEVRDECDLDQRTANRYIAIALALAGSFDNVSKLPVTTLGVSRSDMHQLLTGFRPVTQQLVVTAVALRERADRLESAFADIPLTELSALPTLPPMTDEEYERQADEAMAIINEMAGPAGATGGKNS